MSPYQKAVFLKSCAQMSQLPPDEGVEVAFVGRSNAGKSSVLNRITHIKQLARVSKTPGRTQLLNIFTLDEKRRLIDLPGYGFAKVQKSVRERFSELILQYLSKRETLRGLILVMDIRHPMKESDQHMLELASSLSLPVHILLNKCDKISNNEWAVTQRLVKNALAPYEGTVSFQKFSAVKGVGAEELYKILNEWFGFMMREESSLQRT